MRAQQAGGWGGVVGGASSREAPTVEAAGRARAERTRNMCAMSVTLDVSQPDMSALNWAKSWKSPFIFVTAETFQLEIGPYVAVAEAASAL